MKREIIPKAMNGVILENQPLAPLTTWKIGGPAQYLATAAGLEEVLGLMALAQERGWPLFFLGQGSNLLIADAGLPGLTLHLARSLQGLSRRGDTLRTGAGVSLPRLARTAAALGFSGFEFLAGIPGSVGAAVRLNA
ncbi:MAG: FAD-binding protein, partial [Desulfobaccales bacterium]